MVFRILSSKNGSSIDCYIGSLARLVQLYGVNIPEYALSILLSSNNMELVHDEYGEPELSFPSYDDRVDHLFSSCGILRRTTSLQNIAKLNELIEAGANEPFLVWVNSRCLPYLNDKYASLGYMHCLAVESIDYNEARLYDSFVVAVPPVTITVELPSATLLSAINDRVCNSSYRLMGFTQSICLQSFNPDALLPINLLKMLVQQSRQIHNSLANNSTISRYWAENRNLILGYTERADVVNRLSTVKHEIGSDFIIPNRLGIKEFIFAARKIELIGDELSLLMEGLISSWREVLVLLTRAMLVDSSDLIDELDYAFARAESSELKFWLAVSSK